MKVSQLTVLVIIAVGILTVSLHAAERELTVGSRSHMVVSSVSTATAPPTSTAYNMQLEEEPPAVDGTLRSSILDIPSQLAVPNDPYFGKQWALSKIHIMDLWRITTGNAETIVAVLDTGVDQNHNELDGRIAARVNFTDSPSLSDLHGHGTHISGIIAANSNNDRGIAGVAPHSKVVNVKVADDKGRCQPLVVAKGIIWAVNNGARVINISIEFREPSPELEKAVDYAWNHGVVIVAAAGNEGSQSPIYPAYYENCIAVGATKQDDTLAPLSNYGDWVDVFAPGLYIYSTLPDDCYGLRSGTSFATPFVSGLAALLFDVVSDTNGDGRLNDEVRAAIEAGCQEVGHNSEGGGRIDAAGSLAAIGDTSGHSSGDLL